MGQLLSSARFQPVTAPAQGVGVTPIGVGIYLEPNEATSVTNVGYSFVDLAAKFGSTTGNLIQSRIAILRGKYQGDPALFGISTDLSGYDVRADFFTNDLGPGNITLPLTADEMQFLGGQGFTILLAAPVVSGITGTNIVGKLVPFGARVARTANPAARSGGSGNGAGNGGFQATGGGGGYRPPGSHPPVA